MMILVLVSLSILLPIASASLAIVSDFTNVGYSGTVSARTGLTAHLCNNKLIVIGGYDSNNQVPSSFSNFDLETSMYSSTAFANIPNRYDHSSVALPNGFQIIVAGGIGDSGSRLSDTYVYDCAQSTSILLNSGGTWSARSGHRIINFGEGNGVNNLMVMGGLSAPGTYLNDVWSSSSGYFDAMTSIDWTFQSNAPWAPRSGFFAASLNDALYIGGGIGSLGYFNDVWSTTSVSGPWTQMTQSSVTWSPRSVPYFVKSSAGSFIVAGGVGAAGSFNDVHQFTGSTWSAITSAAAFSPRSHGALVEVANKLILISGETSSGAQTSQMYRATTTGGPVSTCTCQEYKTAMSSSGNEYKFVCSSNTATGYAWQVDYVNQVGPYGYYGMVLTAARPACDVNRLGATASTYRWQADPSGAWSPPAQRICRGQWPPVPCTMTTAEGDEFGCSADPSNPCGLYQATCVAIPSTCGVVLPCDAPTPPTGFTSGSCTGTVASGQTCNLAVATGYTLSTGTITLTCSAASLSALPTATPNPCVIAVPPTGFVAGTCTGYVNSGSSCDLALATGYTLASGTMTMSCTATVYSAYPTAAASCTLPATPTGANAGSCAVGSTLTSGNSCSQTLVTGYSASSGSLDRTCTDGVLSSLTTTANPCAIATPPTGFVAGDCTTTVNSGSTCTLTVAMGYTLASGTTVLTCTAAAYSTYPTATPNPCAIASPPTGFTAGTCLSQVDSGSACTLALATGYTLSTGALSLTCTTGAYSTFPAAVQSCLLPATPTGTTANTCNPSTYLASGSSCTLTLQTGYSVSSGSLTLTCTSGSLSSLVVSGNPCAIALPPTGFTSGSCQASVNSGSSCVLALATGFTLASGSTTMTCNAGVYSTYPTATPSPCPVPTPPAGFKSGSCSQTVNSGSSCDLALASGYTLMSGTATLTCTLGSFSAYPSALANPCETAQPPTGFLPGSCNASIPSGSTCDLALKTGYTLATGTMTMKCEAASYSTYPTATGNPCNTAVPPTGFTAGTCNSTVPSGASCELVVATGYKLASGSATLYCSASSYSAYPTASAVEKECSPCSAGYFLISSSVCSPCPVGTYQSASTCSSSCLRCPTPYVSSPVGSTSATNCTQEICETPGADQRYCHSIANHASGIRLSVATIVASWCFVCLALRLFM